MHAISLKKIIILILLLGIAVTHPASYGENLAEQIPIIQSLTDSDKAIAVKQNQSDVNASDTPYSGEKLGIFITLFFLISALSLLAITLLVKQRRKLQQDYSRLFQIIEQSPVAILTTDINVNINYANDAAQKNSGYEKNELLGRKPSLMRFKSGNEAKYKELWDTLKLGKVWSGEFHNQRKDGTDFWERATIYPLINQEGEAENYVAIKEDISRFKEDQKQLRLAATVFKTATEAVVVADRKFHILAVNEAFTDITGYSSAEAIGNGPELLNSMHNQKGFITAILKSLKTKDKWEGEVWCKRKDGAVFCQWLAITALKDDNGKVETYVSIFSDITLRKEAEKKLQYQANFDALTGLANRNCFTDRLDVAINSAYRRESKIALLFIDLDGFKNVNDTLGHSQGDELLCVAASRLKNTLRKTDTISRFGGDEFAIILTDDKDIYAVEFAAEKVQKALAQPFSLHGSKVYVTASIGITLYPDDGKTAEELIRKADSAMYIAKEKGRNNHQFFTPEIEQRAQKRREIESELRQALANSEFVLNYQPIVDSMSGDVVTAEALIRWHHPTKGIVPPAEFIQIAEETGLILPIGNWVLLKAASDAAQWQQTLANPPKVAVNLSSVQFQRQNIYQYVQQVLDNSQLPPEQLILEMTESLLMDDDNTTNQLNLLRQLGVSLSIDDFGTGYSSLSYLKKFPLSNLKIDRSFVIDLTTNAEDKALIDAIIAMAQSLHLKVTAEGVETFEQAEYLRSKACEFIQGYYYSKPLLNEDFIKFVGQEIEHNREQSTKFTTVK